MAENTDISWARHTFNSYIGCTKVSPACKNCYAERDWDHRFHRVQWGPNGARSLTGKDSWKKPLRWNAIAKAAGEIHTVFSNSLSDVFDDHPSIELEWRVRHWKLIAQTQNLEWLLLTKRPENWPLFLPVAECRAPFENIRLGVSIEDQERCDERAPKLMMAHYCGFRTFVSYEPACGPVDWDSLLMTGAVDWLISGGESGPAARFSHPDLFRAARDAAARHGVPFHHKQNGAFNADGVRVGVEAAGRLLDGVLHDAFPVAA